MYIKLGVNFNCKTNINVLYLIDFTYLVQTSVASCGTPVNTGAINVRVL